MENKFLKLNRDTRFVPIVGYPMGHAVGPTVYNHLFACLGINAIMWPLEIEKGRLPELLSASNIMKMNKLTFTMPHKADIIPLLDEVDPVSRLFNSVNTVKIVDGKSYGTGLDGKGCVGVLKERTSLENKHIMILGAGSICGAIGYELFNAGVKNISVLNRSLENAQKVKEILEENTGLSVDIYESTNENLDNIAEKSDIFLQCTPLGLLHFGADHEYLGFLEKFPKHCLILDAICNPLKTSLLKKAEEIGLETIEGIDMMLYQMTEIFDFWYGLRPDKKMRDECKEILLV